MPQIIMGPSQTGALEASVKRLAYAFLEKLSTDDTLPGLHIEPINGAVDERVRTGRVNDFYRAILFKVRGQGAAAHYVYLGVLAHDDAIAFAKRARLTVNPVNGIAELITASEPVASVRPTPPTRPVDDLPPPLLVTRGVDREALVDGLGLDLELATAALTALDEDEILALAGTAVQWQGLALIDLAGGTSVGVVKQTLSIGADVELPADEEADEYLLSALQHPAARMQFAFIEDDDELRRAIEEPDFAAWRVFLHPEQRRYASATYNGAFRLSGGAGTGKTVVLLHRARALSRRSPQASVLLTTFTKTLADAMRADLRRLDPTLRLAQQLGDPGVYVCGIDAAVSAVLRLQGKDELAVDVAHVLGHRSAEIAGRTPDSCWVDAAGAAGDLVDALRGKTFLSAEYAMVVLPQRITERDDYLRARRPGRGVALDRRKRLAVWDVVQAYRSRSGVDGSIDFGEAAAIATAALERRAAESGRLLDHVLVDEGQDLKPTHWQFLRALVAEGRDDLFLAEDSHQRIYGQPVVLGRYGIRIVGRSQRLRLNYRTTAQTLHYAVGVLQGADFVDLEDAQEVSAYRSARSGPAPLMVHSESLGDELEATAKHVRRWLETGVDPQAIGILVRDAQHAGQVVRGLEDRNVKVKLVESGSPRSAAPVVMTMHRAKGMEFSRVLLFGVNQGLLPAEYLLRGLTDADRADVLLRERSLLYVAATRARDELVVTSSGQPSSYLP